jgi:hypothetical protein
MDRVVSAWYKEGKRHREGDLPAVIYESGGSERYINGIKKDDIQFDILRERFKARLHEQAKLSLETFNHWDRTLFVQPLNYASFLPEETIE